MRYLFAFTLAIATPFSASAQAIHSSVVTPANAFVATVTVTGTQNDYAPVAFTGQPVVIRANNASALTITGFANPIDGQELTIVSVGAGNVFLSHQTTSAAANQLTNTATSGATPLAAGNGLARYVYDGTTAKWRLLGHERGGWITPTFSAADYTASGSMTWTVDAGDVGLLRYRLSGKTLEIVFNLSTTSVGGTLSTDLYRTIPGGFTATSSAGTAVISIADNGAWRASLGGATGATLDFNASVGGPLQNWLASTNSTYLFGDMIFEVN